MKGRLPPPDQVADRWRHRILRACGQSLHDECNTIHQPQPRLTLFGVHGCGSDRRHLQAVLFRDHFDKVVQQPAQPFVQLRKRHDFEHSAMVREPHGPFAARV
jgi:hypothetical protein